jgi:hypothetical protein
MEKKAPPTHIPSAALEQRSCRVFGLAGDWKIHPETHPGLSAQGEGTEQVAEDLEVCRGDLGEG